MIHNPISSEDEYNSMTHLKDSITTLNLFLCLHGAPHIQNVGLVQ